MQVAGASARPFEPYGGLGFDIGQMILTFAYSFSIGVAQTFDSAATERDGTPRPEWHLADNSFCAGKKGQARRSSWACYFQQVNPTCSGAPGAAGLRKDQYLGDWFLPEDGGLDLPGSGDDPDLFMRVKGFEAYDKLWASAAILR